MRFLGASELTGARAWDAMDLAATPDATVRLHWTDAPCRWLVHDGVGVFVVLDGVVDMHCRTDTSQLVERFAPGRLCVAEVGDEHVGRRHRHGLRPGEVMARRLGRRRA